MTSNTDPEPVPDAQFRRLVETSIDYAIVSLDPDLKIVTWNSGAENLFGYERSEVLGTPGEIIFTPEDRAAGAPEREARRAVEEGRAVDERWHVTRAGDRFWASGLMMPVRDDPGRLTGFLKILRDQTDRKRAEEENERLLIELARANAAKDQLLGMVSHELRTPLTAILGNADILRRRFDGLTGEQVRAAIGEIWEQAVRLDSLVENMLSLAHVERDAEPDLEPALLQRILPAFLIQHRKKHPGCAIQLDVPDDLPAVLAQPAYLLQVLDNLVGNAEKYSGSLKATAGIAIVVREHSQERVSIAVLDRGPGVPEADLGRVFEPFYRSEETARVAAGAGLGLAVCRRLVEVQGGEIWAEGRPGGGLQVTFTLPTQLAEEE